MKAENINVSEWVFYKPEECLLKVREIIEDEGIIYVHADSSKVTAIGIPPTFRKPTIADLNKGDVFENEYWQWTVLKVLPNGQVEARRSCNSVTSLFAPKAKVKIISLASEKVGPERKTATVWVNCYPNGSIGIPSDTRQQADTSACIEREACVQVTVPWTKGEGVGE